MEKVRVLLARGADPRVKDSRGGTALTHARSKRQAAAADLLESVLANPEVRRDDSMEVGTSFESSWGEEVGSVGGRFGRFPS